MEKNELNEDKLGVEVSEILTDIERSLWLYDLYNENVGKPLNFSDDALRAAIKIFSSVLLSKMWKLQENEDMENQDRISMAENLGNDIRRLVKTYTNIDSHDLFKK